jgi:hypothetical protein
MSSDEEFKDSIRYVDYWTVLKVEKEGNVTYRLLSSTDDQFFDRTIQDEKVDFHGYSGSVYRCKLGGEGVCPIMKSVLTQWQDRFENPRYSIKAISFEQFLIEWETYKPKLN